MLIKSHVNRGIAAIALVAIVVFLVRFSPEGEGANDAIACQPSGDTPPRTPPEVVAIAEATKCKITQIGPKCGTPLNLEPSICNPGEPTCFGTIWEYETFTNCKVSEGAGRTLCKIKKCHKIIIKQGCVDNHCVLDEAPTLAPILDGTEASGPLCGNPPPTEFELDSNGADRTGISVP